MENFLKQLPLPPGWEVWGVAGAGVVAALLAFFVGRRLFAGQSPPLLPKGRAGPPRPDPFEVGSRSEKRAAFRRKGSSVEVELLLEGQPGPPTTGWVQDRSAGGLGLSVECEFACGTVLKVRPRNAPATAPWVEIEVRSCKPEDAGWLLGCSFRETPPYSVLLLFG
jgi:PilZ domain